MRARRIEGSSGAQGCARVLSCFVSLCALLPAQAGAAPPAVAGLAEEAYQRALDRWIEERELYINCGGPLLDGASEHPARGATKDADRGEQVVWIGDEATSGDLEPVENEFFRLTPLDEGSAPGLAVASTTLGAFDARGTEPGLDQDDAIFYTQRQGAFRYDIPVEDGTWELTLYFGNALRETAGSGKCFFRIEVEESRLSFEEAGAGPCQCTGKDGEGERVPHPAFGRGVLYDPFDHADRLYSAQPPGPCNFATCPANGMPAQDDPDRDGVPASLECGSGAATALRYQVDVTGGALTVVVGYPVLAEGEPSSDGAPFLSGMSVWRLPGHLFHRGDVDQNEALELTDAIQILGYLFLGSVTMVPLCEDAADANDDGIIDLSDAIFPLFIMFTCWLCELPAPGGPDNPCGPDPTEDPLGCVSYGPWNCQ